MILHILQNNLCKTWRYALFSIFLYACCFSVSTASIPLETVIYYYEHLYVTCIIRTCIEIITMKSRRLKIYDQYRVPWHHYHVWLMTSMWKHEGNLYCIQLYFITAQELIENMNGDPSSQGHNRWLCVCNFFVIFFFISCVIYTLQLSTFPSACPIQNILL